MTTLCEEGCARTTMNPARSFSKATTSSPKKVKDGSIVFTQDDLAALLFRVVVLLPGAMLLFGVAVWFNRRA